MEEMKTVLQEEVRNIMEDLTVSEDNDHLGASVRGGQEPSQSLNVAYWKSFWQGDEGISDKG